MSTISNPIKDPTIAHRNCPTGCAIFHEHKMGAHGPFYVCHRCKNSISEGPKGGIDAACGTCSICNGLLFWRTLPNGTRFKACWSQHKHTDILKP